jgi:mannose-6-phosphate isomerase
MTKTELANLAQTPLKQLPNRVWRTYQGGALIDRWKRTKPEKDGNTPEEWIMSAIPARGKNRPPEEGLSLLTTPSGVIPLNELVGVDPELFLGQRVARKFGTTGVLIKMLDSRERLTIQVHPDKPFARAMLNSAFGKTSPGMCWADVRSMERKAAFISVSRKASPRRSGAYFSTRKILQVCWIVCIDSR